MYVYVFRYSLHITDKYTNNKYSWEIILVYSNILILILYYIYPNITYIQKA